MIRLSRLGSRPGGARLQRRWAALVAAGATLAAAGPASADPISGAFVAALGLTGTAAAVATAAVTFVLTATANWALSKLTQRGPDTSAQRQANIASLQLGEVPRVAIFGEACTGGSLVQAFNGGGAHSTDWEVQVIALADHECEGLTGFLIDDAYHDFTGDGAVTGESGLEIWWRPGTEDQAFPSALRTPAGFDADDNLAGVAHVWVKYTAEWVQARGGRARFRWVVKGLKCYDPRLDDTVEGGEGDHRWDDPSTRQWSDNAKVCQYNYDRGIYACGRVDEPDQLLIGRGLSALEAPPERVIAWANLCDEAVALKGGGTEPRYRVGGVIQADQPFVEVAQWFADAMGGHIIQPEGGFDVEPGAAKSVVAEITDDDLLVGRPARYRDFRSGLAAVNTVLVRYIEPAQNWNEHAAPVRRDLAAVLADGPEEEVLSLPLVTSGTQAQRIAEARLRQRRLERSAEIVLGPRFNWLEEGDWIGWTSARHQAGERVVFRIENHGIDAQRHIALRLEEISAASYDWTAADDEITPGTVAPTPSTPAGALSLSGLSASAVSLNGQPGIRLTWTPPTDPAIRTVHLEVRVKGQTASATTFTDQPSAGTLDITNGVSPDTLMQWRAWPRGPDGRAYTQSAWTDITVGTLISGGGGVDTSSKTVDADPSDYRAKGVGVWTEVKWRDTLGVPGSGDDVEGVLQTVVFSVSPGVLIGQRFDVDGGAWTRWEVASPADSWGTWSRIFEEAHKPDWDTDIQNRAPELTDGRIAAGLDSDGRLADGVTPFDRLSGRTADRMTYVGGGGVSVEDLRPAAPNADVTANNNAEGVIGAGAALWWNTVPVGGIDPRAVTPSRMALTDRVNLFPDPDLGDDDIWNSVGSVAKLATPLAMGSEYIRRLLTTGSTNYYELKPEFAIKVEPGEVIRLGFAGYINASSGQMVFSARWYSDAAASTFISSDTIGVIENTATLTRVSAVLTAPSTARRLIIRIARTPGGTGTANFGEPVIERVAVVGRSLVDEAGNLLTSANIAQNSSALGSLMDSEATVGAGLALNKDDTSWQTVVTADEVVVEEDGAVIIDANLDIFMNFGTWNYVEVRIARTPAGGGTTVQIGAVAGLNQVDIPSPGRWQGPRVIRRKDVEGGDDSLTPGEWVYALQIRNGRGSDAILDDNLATNASIIVNSYRKPVVGD